MFWLIDIFCKVGVKYTNLSFFWNPHKPEIRPTTSVTSLSGLRMFHRNSDGRVEVWRNTGVYRILIMIPINVGILLISFHCFEILLIIQSGSEGSWICWTFSDLKIRKVTFQITRWGIIKGHLMKGRCFLHLPLHGGQFDRNIHTPDVCGEWIVK